MTTHSHPRRALCTAILLAAVASGRLGLAQMPRPEIRQALVETGSQPTVHGFYFVPSDKQAKPAYALAIRNALLELQNWYQKQMGGVTFHLADPVVQTVNLPHPAVYYQINPPPQGGDSGLWFWYNSLNDAFALTGGGFFDPQNVWIYYIDADTGCNQISGATSGVSLLPANDLRGLNSQQTVDPCAGPPGDQFPANRWIGGLGHLMGIAFGLGHPPGCDQGLASCDSKALMWLGFYDYPNTYLRPDDIAKLKNSGYFLPGSCSATSSNLCTTANRFEISATWQTGDGRSGVAKAWQVTPDTGYLTFFSDTNVEAVIKVLNGCGVNNSFWVFAGGLTNVNTVIRVRDTVTGDENLYTNPANTAFQPLQRTADFKTCDAKSQAAAASEQPELAAWQPQGSGAEESARAESVSGTSLLLNGDRFKIDVTWKSGDGKSGSGMPVALTSDTGYFWFFNSANVEMIVKVLNGCGAGGNYWVFAGGLTDQDVTIKVTDTTNGKAKTYHNPQGTPFAPIQDTGAFATCP